MLWKVVAPFFKTADTRWIDDFAPPSGNRFEKVCNPRADISNFHARPGRLTPLKDWFTILRWTSRAFRQPADGIVTVFPQMAVAAGLVKLLLGRKIPIVAWCFNVGAKPGGAKLLLTRLALRKVDRIVVHSSGEIAAVAKWFGVSPAKVQFRYLQVGRKPVTRSEAADNPYLLAMGSANRDYATLLQAVERLGVRTILAANQRVLSGLRVPPCVEVRSNLSPQECRDLLMGCKLTAVPLLDVPTASGQVSIVEAMLLGKAVIATRGIGTVDYIADGENGILVEPADAAGLETAIARTVARGRPVI